LLLLEYRSFISFFKTIQSHLPDIIEGKILLKSSSRIAAILLPLLATLAWKNTIKQTSPINGIYDVKQMTINDSLINLYNIRRNDSMLTRIYFETNNICVLQYNSTRKRITVHYAYNADSSQLHAALNNHKKATMNFKVSKLQNDDIKLDGTLSKNSLSLILKKIE